MGDLIADYLADIGRQLPGSRWKREVLAELDDHLRESAAAVGPAVAIERFGAAADVAHALLAERTRADVTRGGEAVLGLGLLAGSVLAVTGLAVFRGENPWAVGAVPWSVLVGQAVGAIAFQVAAVSIAVAYTRHRWCDRSTADCGLVARATAVAACAFVIGSGSVSFTEWQRARLASDLHIPHPVVLGLGVLLVAALGIVALVIALRVERAAAAAPALLAGRPPRVAVPPLRLAHRVADRLAILDPAQHGRIAGVAWAVAAGGAVTMWCLTGLGEFPPGQAVFNGAVEAAAVVAGLVVLGPSLGLVPSREPRAA